jgi:hypothetical protein
MNISLSKHSNSSYKIYVTLRFFLPKHSLEVLILGGFGSLYSEYIPESPNKYGEKPSAANRASKKLFRNAK